MSPMELSGERRIARTHGCGALTLRDAGTAVTLCGWVQRRRDLGALIFITLRDRSGIIQCVFNKDTDAALAAAAFQLRSEYTVTISGVVSEREDAVKNPKMATGDIEVIAQSLQVFSKAETTPFEILEDSGVNETLRLQYRYLDLRRPDMQRNFAMRHRITQSVRRFFDEEQFYEIETPMLTKSTPEGSRDYLVPSRLHPGKFYSLPQSPQQYKQLLMIAGFDRYFQLTRCMRDEDLRLDRQPEFTQIDMEMSFVDVDDILDVNERLMQTLFREVLNQELALPLPRLTYREAMERFGSDKPDTRFGYELCDLTGTVKNSGFGVFDQACASGGAVRAICIDGGAAQFSRKDLDAFTLDVKTYGAGGLAWIRLSDGAVKASFEKYVSAEQMQAICAQVNARDGDLVCIVADADGQVVFDALGALRGIVAKKTGVIDPARHDLLWVVDFPMFEYSAEDQRYVAKHHPFTAPLDSDADRLESDPQQVCAKAYDMVMDGFELGGGSIRIHDSDMQARMFRALGISEEALDARFGHLIEALRYGTPPHGGLAFGLDRICMLFAGCDNLRDVIAFPKTHNAADLMMRAPDTVDAYQLEELHIRTVRQEEAEPPRS